MKNTEIFKKKLSPSQVIRKFGQFIYLSCQGSTDNNLWENASACSFNFIFSFIPVIMIIFTVLVSLLRVSPDMLQYVKGFCEQIEPYYDFWPLLENLLNKKSFSFFDYILGIWVIWMARKLFLSIVRGLFCIFHEASPRKTAFNQVLTFISEFVLVIVFIIFIIGTFLFNKLLNLPVFDFLKINFPFIFRTLSNVLVSSVLYIMFFIFSLLSFKFISGTKPAFKICVFYALLNTGITFVVSFYLNKFMNLSNYNIIYGTISTVIVMLFKVYMFFAVFLFCAQMVYVSQFFDNLLISQLYIMQYKTRTPFEDLLCKKLFTTPTVSKIKNQTMVFQPGDIVYSEGDVSKYVYYIVRGSVSEIRGNTENSFEQGCFFGEISGFLNIVRNSKVKATEETEVIRFHNSTFFEIIKHDHIASSVALANLNSFMK